MNGILETQELPTRWKKAKVVLIPKGDMGAEIKKYRPICLIDCMGKLLEHLIKVRLSDELAARDALSDRQFGFREGRSTVQAIEYVVKEATDPRWTWGAVIFIDIKNAFNTAKWSRIMDTLREIGVSEYIQNIVGNYFKERALMVGKETLDMCQGVPQGSVLGPILWNVVYNGVLNLVLPEGCTTAAFADDFAAIIRADTKQDLIENAEDAVNIICRWIESQGLEIAPEKTEAIVLKGPRKRDGIVFGIGDTAVAPSKQVKYLGVWLDEKLTYSEHVRKMCEKASRQTAALSRLLPNMKGPGTMTRRMLASVVASVLLYAAPIWGKVISTKKYRNMLLSTQRKALLRVTRAYRTVSLEAVAVIGETPPLDLLVDERRRLYKEGRVTEADRAREKEATLVNWIRRWEELEGVAQWTKTVIPDLRAWLECKFKKIDHHMTQFLSGHGCFRSYTHRIGKVPHTRCIYCEEEVDDPEHTILRCSRWRENRTGLRIDLEEASAVNFISWMLSGEEMWNEGHKFVAEVLKQKEREEREFTEFEH